MNSASAYFGLSAGGQNAPIDCHSNFYRAVAIDFLTLFLLFISPQPTLLAFSFGREKEKEDFVVSFRTRVN